ncbi:hypothetical protein B0A78_10270 [Flavobacterium columnare NBRC 100251 = ATCC 23463]|uniref:Transcription elongation factor n=2 Tax=Flavobacterium columnare TaxID=996 RepID=G8X4U0_FLACA|nr:hypothetical protein [Flavobacterium columnare]AEW86138.1 hypothetical protein FCOL_06585 [Flavobacterium columnare ATCC 49512]AMO19860.1 hypothetical protein UN65_05405 [Flavobacterium columnare]ANO48655.1 hypothetical protein Pf1_00407 [Flavobacterium columnare]APT23307.1 hypothetical protein BU993_12170 [Flavobacterium columnare]AUX17798.1 hypothetical protein AQ623_05520 [Flavobacterium columnare]
MTLKQQIHTQYLQILQDRIDVFQDMITDLAEDASNDAKGSAGDKHETALSMMHLEQEKLSTKLREAIQYKAILEKIDTSQKHKNIGLGSLVKTNQLTVFVSCALPKLTLNDQVVFGISPNSPLAEKLIGQSVAHQFDLNGTLYQILEVH